ncbi:MAG: hypothetical protein LBL49_07145 [Clostridiales Family XIII bacterium]|nr:hypothetical protein [Clostridiales Family XIII bacterium]
MNFVKLNNSPYNLSSMRIRSIDCASFSRVGLLELSDLRVERRDTVKISSQARRKQIDDTIQSGEPLRGVGFKEFEEFIYRSKKYGYGSDHIIREMYSAACRGANDIIAKRDFYRTDTQNKGVEWLPGIVKSDAFQEELAKVLGRYANDEEMTIAEKN